MEIYKEELKIIDLFRKNILKELTIAEIMKILHKESYTWTYNALQKLSKNVLISEKRGNTTLVKLDLNNKDTITYLSHLDRKEAFLRNIPLIEKIIESISKKTPFFILLVTGSYATGTQRKDSDIDLVVIVDKEQMKKDILPYIKEITRLEEKEVHTNLFTKEEFYTMLVNEEENFGKECFRKHLLFYGAEAYYQIIKEAVKNGISWKI